MGTTTPRRSTTGRTIVGLMATLVPLGALAGSVGAFLAAHRQTLVVVAALVVIALGVVQVLGIAIPGLARTGDGGSDRRSIPAVFLLGAAYGVAGVCTGPILGAVLTLAAVGGSPASGAILLGIDAVGMVAPLLVVVLLWRRGAARMRRLLAPKAVTIGPIRTTVHGLVAGGLSIVLGALLLATSAHLGTTTLLPIATQVALEHGAAELGASVPNLAVVVVAAVGVAAWLVVRALRARRAPVD